MKYVPLIWSGIWRKRSRTVLMLLQIVSAFLLFGILQGLASGVQQAIARTHSDRLYVTSSVSIGDTLPIGLLSKIRSIPGVLYASPRGAIAGTYIKPTQVVPAVAMDMDDAFRIYAEETVTPGALEAMRKDRAGTIAGGALARKYGWKVGDHIVLQTPVPRTDGSRDWGFDIVGFFEVPEQPENANALIIDFDYLNEARSTGRDRVDMYVAKIADPSRGASVALAIDKAFANSDHETRTQSEGDLVSTQLQQTVDLNFIVRGIVGAVFFALLLATGALLMQSLREREPELAVLKTVGFSDRAVLVLLLTEAIVLCVLAASIGIGGAALLMRLARSQIGISHLPLVVVALGFGCALLLAIVGGCAPALRGARLVVADALADR